MQSQDDGKLRVRVRNNHWQNMFLAKLKARRRRLRMCRKTVVRKWNIISGHQLPPANNVEKCVCMAYGKWVNSAEMKNEPKSKHIFLFIVNLNAISWKFQFKFARITRRRKKYCVWAWAYPTAFAFFSLALIVMFSSRNDTGVSLSLQPESKAQKIVYQICSDRKYFIRT